MGVKEQELNSFRVGKKEQYAARIIFFIAGFGMSTWAPDTNYKRTFTNWCRYFRFIIVVYWCKLFFDDAYSWIICTKIWL